MRVNLVKDPYNIVITGVGGQGNVMASRVLSNMLVRKGFKVTIGETFGMSQRGGSVMSHIRVSSASVWSPQIPKGAADLIVALEPIEAIRVLAGYGNPSVKVVVNLRPIYPVGVITGEEEYPSAETIRATVTALAAEARFLAATEEAIRLGNPILGNIIMIGAVAGLGVLPIDREIFERVIRDGMPAARVEGNLRAFAIGEASVALKSPPSQ
ncbi:MAG: indolepyruvate ferredoxin oxidoreductase [Syntrophobacterales bacterium CG_4_8_14_3_um_filter_58_8]|nr:MAG: indolepyruvate ferredoxin oxidoreductase [Syntrophaceae bacterium CG2_30_58_14]PJC74441.1 MAG: indolepyruvate ferredoxin oxidoreductase [Syntrophobacterales bacterium CG_4_8_14_3_um_filter_58_8]